MGVVCKKTRKTRALLLRAKIRALDGWKGGWVSCAKKLEKLGHWMGGRVGGWVGGRMVEPG